MVKKQSMASKIISGFGRSGEQVLYISAEPVAREKARQFARRHGGRVYRAVAVGRVLRPNTAFDLGRGYIVAIRPPREFVYWRRYYAKVMEIQDMSKTDRLNYVHAVGSDIFGARGKYRSWLQSYSRALGGKKPKVLIKTAAGAQKVYDALLRIEYGVMV